MKVENYVTLEFLSRSTNEAFARTAAAAFAAQLDPTLDEVGDIRTAVSEAVTNAIVHAYPDKLGKIVMKLRILEGRHIGTDRAGLGPGHRQCAAGSAAAFYHRRRGTQRHGLYHHGELHGQADGEVHSRKGNRGVYA